MEDKVPGIKALSFVDDVAWLAEGKSEDALSTRLEEVAKAAQELRHGQGRGDCPEQEKKNRPGRRRGITVGETQSTSMDRRPDG